MDRRRLERRWSGWLMALAVLASCGCQTVKTPEEKIANSNLPAEFTKVSMPEYVVEPPDLLLVEVLEALPGRPITGERLVRPDGKITLGFYGEVYVAGLTTTEIKEKIVLHLRKFLPDEVLGLTTFDPKTDEPRPVEPRDTDRVFVDVTAYNSKVYYVQGDVAQPGRLPITGNETVLDAIARINGLTSVSSKKIWIARPQPNGPPVILKFHWHDVTAKGLAETNYQILPGDRLYVAEDKLVALDTALSKIISPMERVFGVTILGTQTISGIKFFNQGGQQGFGGGGF
jgi:polysaccharide biosynthesis/export protein